MIGRTVLGTDDDEETGKLNVLIVKNMEDRMCCIKKKKGEVGRKIKIQIHVANFTYIHI